MRKDKFNEVVKSYLYSIYSKNLKEIKIIFKSSELEKRSKIRNFFEKSSDAICVAFYEDNIQTLTSIAQKFLRERKVNISQKDLNLLAERTKGDRINLSNELVVANLTKEKFLELENYKDELGFSIKFRDNIITFVTNKFLFIFFFFKCEV